ncbi:hypothetical protein [Ralstonia sp. 25mfcol4.1]|uniref:hypothetical protein n=1 Tax=Ralstonia sp. 25mfcol4.1 TaxID=1761899 RepID=UPI00048E46AB|nr:hypothetical protein [Ralstonia sp. 25mfcol4.1]
MDFPLQGYGNLDFAPENIVVRCIGADEQFASAGTNADWTSHKPATCATHSRSESHLAWMPLYFVRTKREHIFFAQAPTYQADQAQRQLAPLHAWDWMMRN